MVDDGSDDDSRACIRQLAARFPSRIRDLTGSDSQNRGAAHRLNQLVAEASGGWIAVLNSDDAFTPGRFELLQARLRGEETEFACGYLLIFDECGVGTGTKRGIEQPEFAFPGQLPVAELARQSSLTPILANQNFIATTSNMVFTRSLYERIGGFREFRYVHDWDFALRASVLGRCLYLPHFLTLYRSHRHNSIKTDASFIEREVRALFGEFEREFPATCAEKWVAMGIEGNRYLA
jgi:GT2 family glycosyltransferase